MQTIKKKSGEDNKMRKKVSLFLFDCFLKENPMFVNVTDGWVSQNSEVGRADP